MKENQIYVVTGATSFIASGLLKELAGREKQVYAICRPGSKRMDRIPPSRYIRVIECDLADLGRAAGMIREKCDVLYHLGWDGTGDKDEMYLQNLNVKYTLDAAALAQKLGCHTFVGAGSQAEYGLAETKLTDKTPAFPVTGYGMAKLCAGQMSRVSCCQMGICHIWVRILSVYGPMDASSTLIMYLMDSLMNGKTPRLTDGNQIWDYLYIEDCAKALYLLAERGQDQETYVLGSGVPMRIREYAEIVRDVVSPGAELAFGAMPYHCRTPKYLVADTGTLEKLGICAGTTFEEGIRRMLEYERGRVGARP